MDIPEFWLQFLILNFTGHICHTFISFAVYSYMHLFVNLHICVSVYIKIFAEVVSLYGYNIIFYFLTQGCTFWMGPPPHTGLKVGLQPEPMWPTSPIYWVGEFKYAGIFSIFTNKISFRIFCLPGHNCNFFYLGGERWELRFFWNNHTCFWGHAACKRGWGIHFEGIFRFWQNISRIFFWRRKAGMTERENDEMREQRNGGTPPPCLPTGLSTDH